MAFLHGNGKVFDSYRSVLGLPKRKSKVCGRPRGSDSLEMSATPVILNAEEDVQPLPRIPCRTRLQPVNASLAHGLEEGEPVRTKMAFAEPFLSAKLCKVCASGVNLGSFLRVHRYYWEKDKKRLGIRSLGSCNFGWWFGTLMFMQYFIFVIVQLLRHLKSHDGFDFDKLLLLYALTQLSLPLVFQITVLVDEEALTEFVNHASEFCICYAKYFNKDLRATETAELKMAPTFLQLVYAGHGLVVCFVTCASIAMPNTPTFVSSLCSDPNSSFFTPLRISSAALLTVVEIVCCAHCCLFIAGLVVVICMVPTIKYLSILNSKTDRYGAQDLLHLYRQLYLIFEELNQFSAMPLLPAVQNIMITLSVFGLYGAVRAKGVVCFTLIGSAWMAFSCLILGFRALGMSNTASSKLLATWRRDARFSRREVRALRPIRIRLASYAYVDAGILLTIIDVIVNYSITLFITT